MEKLKVTNGEWAVGELQDRKYIDDYYVYPVMIENNNEDMITCEGITDISAKYNATLIADALNTKNRTGLTPSQMAELLTDDCRIVLDFARIELAANYKKLGYNESNITQLVEGLLNKLNTLTNGK